MREGDTVPVHSLDRLARNPDDVCRIVQGLTRRGEPITSVKESLPFTGGGSPVATLMIPVRSAFAEFERALTRERRMPGGL